MQQLQHGIRFSHTAAALDTKLRLWCRSKLIAPLITQFPQSDYNVSKKLCLAPHPISFIPSAQICSFSNHFLRLFSFQSDHFFTAHRFPVYICEFGGRGAPHTQSPSVFSLYYYRARISSSPGLIWHDSSFELVSVQTTGRTFFPGERTREKVLAQAVPAKEIEHTWSLSARSFRSLLFFWRGVSPFLLVQRAPTSSCHNIL